MMNGKFHFAWGDFGSLRNQAALEYECFRALMHGARVCVGDQLHPTGRIDPVVYERIGRVFAAIETKEPWLRDTRKYREVGVFLTADRLPSSSLAVADQGVYQMLSELHIPFDYVNQNDELSSYRLLILPDCFIPNGPCAKRIDEFVRQGGRLLVTGRSAARGDRFVLECIDARYLGESQFANSYMRLDAKAFPDLPPIDHVLYERSYLVESGKKALANVVEPYFDRTYDHFCSHRQTPPKTEATGSPAILSMDGCVYIAAPLFTDYAVSRSKAHRDIVAACINMLLEDPMLRCDVPSITEVSLREREGGYVLHLLNYVIQRRAKRIDTIEEAYHVPKARVS